MDNEVEVREFLRTRRARIVPAQVGLVDGGRRRVPGLRREEVALLAGISPDYYAKLERGSLRGVSPDLLTAVAHALRLNDTESDHLRDLARAASTNPNVESAAFVPTTLRPVLRRFLDSVTDYPVVIQAHTTDFIAGNLLGEAMMSPMLSDPASKRNNARFTFLNPSARTFYAEWEKGADAITGGLRKMVGQYPQDAALAALVQDLAATSDEFRERWASHNVRSHRNGVKRLLHPDVGELEFSFEALKLPDHPTWTMYAYVAEPESPTETRLKDLAHLGRPLRTP